GLMARRGPVPTHVLVGLPAADARSPRVAQATGRRAQLQRAGPGEGPVHLIRRSLIQVAKSRGDLGQVAPRATPADVDGLAVPAGPRTPVRVDVVSGPSHGVEDVVN